MFREPKRSTSKQNLSVKATSYPISRPERRPLALKEEKQLFLLQGQAESLTSSGDVPFVPNRYYQNGAAEKVLGAVYTPPRVAAALTRWAVRAPADKVLDPSCGEGVFLSAARTRLADLGARKPDCVGVDIHPETAAATGAVCEDFFSWARSAQEFDVVVGNPPFIRSHLFQEASRTLAFSEMVRMGLRPSRLMSTWAPFLAVCCRVLTDTGRLAMVTGRIMEQVAKADSLLPGRGAAPQCQQLKGDTPSRINAFCTRKYLKRVQFEKISGVDVHKYEFEITSEALSDQ